MYVKHDNDNKFYNDNEDNNNNNNDNNDSNDDIDIKNLLQMKTNDKRLFLNFNYITINKYDNNKNKNMNRKIIKSQKSNQPRVKTGGGAKNELYKKFGFL
jgi:hypothetical protein